MTLSKDRIIQIILALVIVVLVGVVFANSRTGHSEEGLTDGETVTEESESDGQEDVAVAPVKTTTPTAAASTKPTTPAPAPTSGGCYPGLSAKKSQTPQGILLAWTPCSSDDFQFYKLVKSSLNSNPSYPSDPVAMSSSNRSASSFIDKTVARATTYYYRVCVVQRLNKVTCGNVASATY